MCSFTPFVGPAADNFKNSDIVPCLLSAKSNFIGIIGYHPPRGSIAMIRAPRACGQGRPREPCSHASCLYSAGETHFFQGVSSRLNARQSSTEPMEIQHVHRSIFESFKSVPWSARGSLSHGSIYSPFQACLLPVRDSTHLAQVVAAERLCG